MSTPRARAPRLRGALVGGCSAVVTAAAHTATGAELPGGAALIVVLLVCATAGAVLARIRLDGRKARVLVMASTLGLAQMLGHLSGLMVAAHAVAALALGAAISAVEYLYVVCSSVLRWLRVYAALALRPQVRNPHFTLEAIVAESVLLSSGLGMRAPPERFATAA